MEALARQAGVPSSRGSASAWLLGRQHTASCSRRPASRRQQHVTRAIFIDRRKHLELAWERQQQREALLTKPLGEAGLTEVIDIEHLEAINEHAGAALVVVLLYSRSCGMCKDAIKALENLSREASQQKARAVFCKHNVVDAWDAPSDISRMYKIRAVPTLVFYDEGAVVQRMTLRDIRNLTGSTAAVQAAMSSDLGAVKAIFRQVLFKTAPGARS